MKFKKPDKPLAEVENVVCRACGYARPLNGFRFFQTKPKIAYMDFCTACEKSEGTLALYRRYNAYGTPEIINAVFNANKTPEIRRTPEQVRLLIDPATFKAVESNEDVVKRELASREMARRRLIYFVTQMNPEYTPSWAHQDICRRLENFVKKVELGLSPRLVIAMPPRHGKSLLASDFFPSWILGLHPEWGIIGASYATSLPEEFSRNMRDRLRSDEYQAIFENTRLRKDAQGIEQWKTTRGGGYIAAGVGTGINGKGMHIGIADDLLKDEEAASSDTIRENTYSWYQSVFRTRLTPGGGILLIGTRWHFDDPTGRVLSMEEQLVKNGVPADERENWDVVSYPAVAEHDEYLMRDGTIQQDADPEDARRLLRKKGDALFPERWPLRELRKLKNTSAPAIWNALFQQNPVPDEGDFFKKTDIRFRFLPPEYRPLCRVFITADYAIKKKETNDFTSIGVFALDANDDLYLLDMRHGRWGTYDIARVIADLVERHKPEVYAGEQGQIHEAVWPVIERELKRRRLYLSVDNTLNPVTDKEVRARPIQARAQQRKFFFSHDTITPPDEYGITMREMLQFPKGKHDDTVDMLAWGARLSLNLSLPNRSSPVEKRKSWKDRLTTNTHASSHMAA